MTAKNRGLGTIGTHERGKYWVAKCSIHRMNRGELDQFGYLDSILQFFTGEKFGRITLHWHCNQVGAWPSRMSLFHRHKVFSLDGKSDHFFTCLFLPAILASCCIRFVSSCEITTEVLFFPSKTLYPALFLLGSTYSMPSPTKPI